MDEIASALDRTARAIDKAITRELQKNAIDLDPAMARILHSIGDARITYSEITARGYYTGSNAAYAKARLMTGGYVTQVTPQDRRRRVIHLTEKGHAVRRILVDLFATHRNQAARLQIELPSYVKQLRVIEHLVSGQFIG